MASADDPKTLEISQIGWRSQEAGETWPIGPLWVWWSRRTIVADYGELQVEICLNDLEKDYAQCETIKDDPVITYKETITAESSEPCTTKSQNKHNRIHGTSKPYHQDLVLRPW